MKQIFPPLTICAGIVAICLSVFDLSAQSVKVVRRDTLTRADTARISRPDKTRSVSDDLLKSVVHPSPQSAAYARYGEYPVDYSTGVPKIEIPLYTLDTGDYQLPISLSYHASGIKVTDVSTPVGLGWVLNAGGVISRTCRAVPDRYGSWYDLYFKDRAQAEQELAASRAGSGNGHDWWEQALSGFAAYDSETDRYAYNLPGKAGIFRYDSSDGSIYAVPHDPLRIEETTTGYKITDTDGTVYTFETLEQCGGSAGQYVGSYYLSSIVTGERHNVITFTYGYNSMCQVRYRTESYEFGERVYWWQESDFGMLDTYEETDYVDEFDRRFHIYNFYAPLLTAITWNGITVSISYTADRQDAQPQRMTSISVSEGGNPVRYITLDNNGYFGTNARNYRLKLSGLTVRGNSSATNPAETWSFSYNSLTPPDHYNAPINGTERSYEDYWGYWNGNTSLHLIPNGIVSGYTTANRSSVEYYMKMCSLESITYPTKGKTTFTMEANRVGNTLVGGLRVAAISNYDYDGTLLEKRTYEYADAERSMDITDDLFSWNEDVHYYYNPQFPIGVVFTETREHFFATASPVLPLSGFSGNPVNYLSVTEYVGGTASANLGKNVYTYFLDTEYSYPGSDEDYYLPPLPVRYYSNEYNNDEGNIRALLSKKEVWRREANGTYTKQLTEGYGYDEPLPPHPYFTTGVRIARRGISVIYENYYNADYAPYTDAQDYWDSFVCTNCRAYRRPRILSARTLTDHTTGVSVVTTYTHDSYLRTFKPLTESTTNSDGKVSKTVYTYPFALSDSPYTAMTSANRVDTPVKEEYYYGNTLQRTRETTYGVFNGTMHLPDTLKEKLGSTTRTLVTYNQYDNAGNLRYATTVDGRKFVFLWGYNKRYPVAVIEGLTWSQVQSAAGTTLINNLASCTTSNASTYLTSLRSAIVSPTSLASYPHLVTTYEYVPGMGISTETAPDGAGKFYIYDALGRLARAADSQGEIETFSYSYASGSGTSWTPNRILRSVKKNAGISNTDRIESSVWYDGLGRPVQELTSQATPTQSNLLTRTEYDLAGRQTRTWLPVVTSSSFLSASAFSSAASSTYGTSETRPFSEQVLEASSLDRVPYAYGPGAAWYATSGGGHPVRTEWLGNTASGVTACKYYYVNGTSLAGGSTNYAAGTLSVVRTTDEDGAVSLTFTDKLGRTVLTRQVDGTSTYSDTYYVYDDRGQLRFVLQPQYQVSANLAQFAFQYTYDGRGNLTKKQLPGADYVQYVYDTYDRPAYVQDGRRSAAGTNRWHYYTYDNLGRVATEGECTGQNSSSSQTLLVTNYYDNYSFAGTTDFPSGYFPSTGSWSIGRKTGQKLRVLGASSSSSVPRAWYYDSRGQVTKEVIGHYDNLGYDTRVTTYTYTGQPASVTTTRTSSVSGTPTSQTRTWSYDHVDRLTAETLMLPGTGTTTLATYTYDDLGRLSARRFNGSTSNAETYAYDIRSRTTGISHPKFIQDLAYTFGSDVSASGWKRSSGDTRKAYDFTYDGLHRLKNATYKEGSSVNNHYTENVTGYDRNGNITTLQRYGRTGASSWGVVDNLALTRTGNQLTSVSDSGSAAYSGDFHFTDGASTTTEYSYDSNGNLVSDANKGISSITRNEIDLPQTVTFSGGSTINYYYAADGTKLREVRAVVASGSTTTTTIDWCGDLVLEKVGSGTRAAKRLRLDGGYVDLASGNSARRYFVRDHLGSVRAVVNDAGTVLETDDYYPLGGPLPTGSNTALQPEKYQGKEWNPAASVNVYDFGARLYDPTLGRWLSQDPLAEKYYPHSPYLFCAGNPMRFVDPTGMLTDDYYNLINGKYLGSDAFGTSPRLIDSGLYSSITGGKTMTKNLSSIERLRDNSTTISVDWNQIEEHAQSVADLSRESRLEHQAILVLDREKAKVTSVLGPVGTNSHAEIPHFPAPVTGVSFYDRPGGLIIIGEIHGHPASEKAGMSTEHTMSPDFDVPLAKKMQIPIYGIDAMYGKNRDSMPVHMVTPDGNIIRNVRQTIGNNIFSRYPNWGLDALKFWGRSSFPQ